MPTTPTISSRGTAPNVRAPLNTVLFDTNVWLDYFLGREVVAGEISQLIESISVAGHSIATTVSIKKDLFYILPRELKRLAHAGSDSLPAPSEASFTAVAWAVLESMDDFATVVPLGMQEDFFARHLRGDHSDYEDDVLMATARTLGSCPVVTSDRRLLQRFPRECKTPRQALDLYGCP